MKRSDLFLPISVAALLFFVVGIMYGASNERESFKRAAVEAGHAQYYIDNDFKIGWRWRTKCIVVIEKQDK